MHINKKISTPQWFIHAPSLINRHACITHPGLSDMPHPMPHHKSIYLHDLKEKAKKMGWEINGVLATLRLSTTTTESYDIKITNLNLINQTSPPHFIYTEAYQPSPLPLELLMII